MDDSGQDEILGEQEHGEKEKGRDRQAICDSFHHDGRERGREGDVGGFSCEEPGPYRLSNSKGKKEHGHEPDRTDAIEGGGWDMDQRA